MAASLVSIRWAAGRREGGGGETSFQFHPPYPSSLAQLRAVCSSCLAGRAPRAGARQAGRQADSAGWLAQAHSSEANCPAEMGIRGEVGPKSSFPGLSLSSISQMQVGWALLAEAGDSSVGLVPRAKGHCDPLSFLPLKPLGYPASVFWFQEPENITPLTLYTGYCLRSPPLTLTHFILSFVADLKAKHCCPSVIDTLV